jgi:hypothetical protein
MKMACCLAAVGIAAHLSTQNLDVLAKDLASAAPQDVETAKTGPDERGDPKQFRLILTYHGEADKPYYNLILSVPPMAVQNSPFSLFVRTARSRLPKSSGT